MAFPLLYTVGHSNRSAADFVDLLSARNIQTLVDVRAQPHSSRYPHFSAQALRDLLEAAGMTYHWVGRQLGGRRAARPDSPHRALDPTIRGYADYMDGEAFRTAAAQLVNLAGRAATVILCAERLPEQCHRRLIADYLSLQGVRVIHLIDPQAQREHLLSPEARRESAQLIYDRNVNGELQL